MTDQEKAELALLFNAMHQELYVLAYIQLQDPALAEDAVQTTFEIGCAKFDPLLHSPNPKGWLAKALIHVIHRMQREKRSDLTRFDENNGHANASLPDPAEQMEPDVLYEDLVDTKEYQLIKGIAFENRSYAEAAKEASITYAAYKKRVERARKFLKEKIIEK